MEKKKQYIRLSRGLVRELLERKKPIETRVEGDRKGVCIGQEREKNPRRDSEESMRCTDAQLNGQRGGGGEESCSEEGGGVSGRRKSCGRRRLTLVLGDKKGESNYRVVRQG